MGVSLLEARERIGGRVFGVAAKDGAHRFDLGPAWVWPELNPRTADWLSTLGLALFEQQGRGAGLVKLPSQAVRHHATGFAQQPPSMRLVAAPHVSPTLCGAAGAHTGADGQPMTRLPFNRLTWSRNGERLGRVTCDV